MSLKEHYLGVMMDWPNQFSPDDMLIMSHFLDDSRNIEMLREVFHRADHVRTDGRFGRWSMNALFNVLRWETEVEMQGEPYKINDRFIPILGRLYNLSNPDRAGYFMTRGSKFREACNES